jgi:hypothetical protein
MLLRLGLGVSVLALLGVGCANGLVLFEDGIDGGLEPGPDAHTGPCTFATDCPPTGDPCTQPVCINGECKTEPANEGAACDDDDYCTDGDTCVMGTCTGGPTKPCAPPDTCHVGVCDPLTKGCVSMPGNDGASCFNDTDPCTDGNGFCSSGVCVGGASMDCSFFDNQCNVGVCDPIQGCQAQAYPDGTACSSSNPSPCAISQCQQGACTQMAVGDGMPCNANNPNKCLTGQCQQSVCTAVPVPDGTTCNDNLFCTINDTCQAGTCVGGGPNLCAPATGCFIAFCDEVGKKCSAMPGNDGAPCTDTDVCNTGKHCQTGACVGGSPVNDGMACDDGSSCTLGEFCTGGVCGGGAGPTIYFAEDFHDNSKGWMLGQEWQIGPAMMSTSQSWANPDPAQDHSPSSDNGVAGVVIGGSENPVIHPYYYLTSPPFDTSAATGPVVFGFYRWLNSDYDPYMHNVVEVWDGATWVNLWKTGPSPAVEDTQWTYMSFDVTAHKNAAMQVRFGYDIGSSGVFTVSSWNVDDVLVASAMCP